jgi:ribosomal protein S18 acetylase RimI-like enzyme
MMTAPRGVRALTADLAGHERAYLELEALASAAFDRFAFDDTGAAHAFREFLFERGVAEYAPPAARLLLVDGEPAGMFAVLTSRLLGQRRLAAAVALARAERYREDTELQHRLRLAASTLQRPGAADAYLTRIAVRAGAAGQGLGRWLLEKALEESRALGAQRCVLDVADDNARAIAFYQRAGFVETGRASTNDPQTGRSLGYLHMAKTLG